MPPFVPHQEIVRMLTDTKVRQAKSTEKSYKIYDADGLYIEITYGRQKWRWKYCWQGKEKNVLASASIPMFRSSSHEKSVMP